MHNISIIDDNTALLTNLESSFKNKGYGVITFNDPLNALSYLQKDPADFYLIDYKMPKLNGIEFYTSLCSRLNKKSLPAIILTGVEEIHLKTLNETTIGDFIIKPFKFEILIARIKKILSYYKIPERLFEYKLGNLVLFEDKISCTWHGVEIELTKMEFAMISQLTRRPSCVFSREELLDLCYKDNFDVEDRNIDSHIKRIRKKFRKAKTDIQFNNIKTSYGSGYSWTNS